MQERLNLVNTNRIKTLIIALVVAALASLPFISNVAACHGTGGSCP
jgi:hypothetical protein